MTNRMSRALDHLDRSGTCWLWTGSTTHDGYGHLRDGRRVVLAHRWLYEHLVGTIPDGMQLDHLCRVRRCCNPDHLDVVTSRENTLRGQGIAAEHARKTHCPHGHQYDLTNTWIYRGSRYCRACSRERSRLRRDARRNVRSA